jgi:hypothetical protein
MEYKMETKLNKTNIIFSIMFLLIGFTFGFSINNLFQEPKQETVQIDYNSVCLRTLKSYYVSQNPKVKKQLIDKAAKSLAIDRMQNN